MRSRRMHASLAPILAAVLVLTTAGCDTLNSMTGHVFGGSDGPEEGTPGFVGGFLGGVVADEPRAAVAARQVLSAGGNAADAAAALGLALSVTLPSRASLGAGGACLVYAPGDKTPNAGQPEAVMFVSPAPASSAGADRPAAVPMLARGLFAIQARYGRRPFETLIGPAEQMARFGVPASRAFVRDLGVVAGPLGDDPTARALFFRNGQPITDGAVMVQPDLAATLSQLRVAGVGDLYQGATARRIADSSAQVGAGLTLADLRSALPSLRPPLSVEGVTRDTLAFLPPPADGGLAAAAAMIALEQGRATPDAAGQRALAVVARFRASGGDTRALLAAKDLPPAALPALPASTTFATLDNKGMAVVCAITMNNLFGTGRIAPGTGIVLGASPKWLPPALLSAAIAWNPNVNAFRALAAGSGQAGAPLATAMALRDALADDSSLARPMTAPVPDPGRANVIECTGYLPNAGGSCGWATDPRGAGLAIGSN